MTRIMETGQLSATVQKRDNPVQRQEEASFQGPRGFTFGGSASQGPQAVTALHADGRRCPWPTTMQDDLNVLRLGSSASGVAFNRVCRLYWSPVYAFIRMTNRDPEAVADLTQEFFLRLIETDALKSFIPGEHRFRSWLMVCIRHFQTDKIRSSHAIKRRPPSGWITVDPTDAENVLGQIPASITTPEEAFDRSWAVCVFNNALQQLEQECRDQDRVELFRCFSERLRGATTPRLLDEEAAGLGMPVGSLKNQLTDLRRRYASLVRFRIRTYIGPEESVDSELHYLLGLLARR